MSRAGIIAFTRAGCDLALQIAQALEGAGEPAWACTVSGPERFADGERVHAYESLDRFTAEHFSQDDALVFVGASGIAVRAIAPHVNDKLTDPAVVSVDERGAFAIPLLSGHVGGANELARLVARACGGRAAISTATDVNGLFAVDEWAARNGLAIIERDVAKEVSAALLEGCPVGFRSDFDMEFELPEGVVEGDAEIGFAVTVSTEAQPFGKTLHLVPRAVTVGAGCRKGTDPVAFEQAIDAALQEAHVFPQAVRCLASIDVKSEEPAMAAIADARGWEKRFYSAAELERVQGDFSASDFVKQTVGVDNVCERAALAEGGDLLLPKQARDGITVALAKNQLPAGKPVGNQPPAGKPISRGESAPAGKLVVVGLGPGGAEDMSGRARRALQASDVLAGYTVYVDLVRDEFPEKEVLTTPMRKEVDRCRLALEHAVAGQRVAMVCSGDPGVYGMAGLIYELAQEYDPVPIEVIPGVSASNGGAAVLGAPLMHDYCVISLSDLLTPWETIERRLQAAAEADFVISLYNPSSHKRPDYLRRACDILLERKSPATVCGTVRNIGRDGELASVMTLGELRDTKVDMFTTVFIGSSRTMQIGGKMVTPRGYLQRED